ncbi:MAG: hypothetical protein A3C11_01485 [Candidatus Sungbacteria bacterium RIFCSPHIGHO2_02_FULL_49_12]|uniref:Glycosyltransferase 2-like domain-containing protein n=1 Tax=Candidatus Sungbacteria bacterium RIFCSPHIGHO2_02_FULL_49_12 TaxID=1802271 RepID=A0A1G2KR10_9BACT|nr:MAG: hypothetical protein A3C11_01485 [Candidatus Sungbacteria bacterium RIFCSPHIGHO2_02_FULL_49_12]
MRAIILIPTYNEADNIVPLIREIFSLPIECSVLVIDDNSPDGTARLVRQVMSEFPNLSLLSRPGKSGLAGAYLAGFRKVLAESAADFIITMDADFSHHPKYLPDLIRAAKTADVVIGSRYVNNGGVKNWSLWRRILSFFGNLYARLVTGLPINDLTAGFSAIRLSLLKELPLEELSSEGYAWLIELKSALYARGARIIEIPIIFEERRSGASKISRRIITEGLFAPWRLRFRYRGMRRASH